MIGLIAIGAIVVTNLWQVSSLRLSLTIWLKSTFAPCVVTNLDSQMQKISCMRFLDGEGMLNENGPMNLVFVLGRR